MARKATGTEDASVGHNSASLLKSFIERVERIQEDIDNLNNDKKEVFAEAKGTGFDTKIMKAIIKLRKMEEADRREYEELLELYKAALGMWSDTPLGEAAEELARRGARKPENDAPGETEPDETPEPPRRSRQASDAEKLAADELETKAALARMSVESAAAMAKADHAAGKPLKANPFAARSKQRAAYDKAWCEADGSDGMSLPGETKKKPSDEEQGQ